ncbi:type 1 glutamine amidotransferase [Thiovibrio frasassiensis]|jgi:GMP synthase-like glutamine amidotransferase|uniref:Type 1 glutamine amidotransferase n=1 Tax=Thiovibrio frasassiensis TaxID=2984131 RepID=A0A9X4MG80_9BACT|nr:type 1 glutamine amidotransferase [Thiovibrio frasassiensis]MDG4474958.1 type 1 glutamine amidotransferase [Thiovibrio frasassiensis]
MKFLILQHTSWAEPGRLLLAALDAHLIAFDVVRVWEDWIPDFNDYNGIILLGGAPNVDEEEKFPFLVEEKRFIKRAIAADKPILGFCLGHQLLASVLGAQVGPNVKPSIGFVQGHLTHNGREHPAFVNLPKILPLFKWHSQMVLEPLPKHFSLLATSEQCQVEAFSLAQRPHILGMQFDNQAALIEDIATWLEKDWQWLASFRSLVVRPADMLADAMRLRAQIQQDFFRFFADYLKIIS